MTPSKEEAFAAIDDVIYAIEQCLADHFFVGQAERILQSNGCPSALLIRNATVESSLVFIRKMNEFFGTRKQRESDETLRAYHFGDFPHNGWFLEKQEYDELHLYVAHVSVEGVRCGKKTWPLSDYAVRAAEKSRLFLVFLLESPSTPAEKKEKLKQCIAWITSVLGVLRPMQGGRAE